MGFKRNLIAGEIIGQLLDIAVHENCEVHNAVYMGMGEPLMNEEAVYKSALLMHHPLGRNMGARRITISTCGLPDGIKRLAGWELDVTLAVSLHAPDDVLRSKLMPINDRYPLSELIDACRQYWEATSNRITFEYVMIKGVNMEAGTAQKLRRLLEGIPCNINLIPVNPGLHGFASPSEGEQIRFAAALERAGLDAVIRRERGADICGACGQLAGDMT